MSDVWEASPDLGLQAARPVALFLKNLWRTLLWALRGASACMLCGCTGCGREVAAGVRLRSLRIDMFLNLWILR